ncbi:MAG: uridine diphosphate-N-acetylglucosamine-binding protein YvcK [Anaerolineales bacterium]
MRELLRWLTPGLGVKRWFGLLIVGTALIGLAFAFVLVELYQGGWLPPALQLATLQFFSRPVRAMLLLVTGIGAIAYGFFRLNREIVAPLVPSGQSVVSLVEAHRRKGRGPRVVVIGGGTGMATLLRGIKAYTSNITAIVTVADDGGSSGRLRKSLGVIPPGDFRNCLAALADDEALLTQLFRYRFGGDEDVGGHSFGNLFITTMAEVTGSFEQALIEASRVLSIQGRVLPATLQDVRLCAQMRASSYAPAVRVEGESAIPEASGWIERVYLDPERPAAYPAAVQAILAADLIVAGPGSLYTSVIPNLLVPEIVAAVKSSAACKVYVCNVATQPGETDGFTVRDHVRVIEEHVGANLFPQTLANAVQKGTLPEKLHWVLPDPGANGAREILRVDVVDADRPWRHNHERLAKELMRALARNGPAHVF